MRITHTRSRYIYDLYYKREAISKELCQHTLPTPAFNRLDQQLTRTHSACSDEWLLKQDYADAK